MKSQLKFKNVDQYISLQPAGVQQKLENLRNVIMSCAPGSEEIISYNMPAYKQNGVLVYFAAYKNHIGFYPTSNGISEFEQELGKYKYSKGAIQFPINDPLPVSLIKRIVKFRMKYISEVVKRKKAPVGSRQ